MYIGVDLGGTNIAIGFVNSTGNIEFKREIPTKAFRKPEEIIEDIGNLILNMIRDYGISKKDIKAIGIGIPGLSNQSNGNVIFCVNLHWHDVPLKKILEQKLNIPVFSDNDATVAGLAEYEAGALRGVESGVLITLGTGIGGGIIINGQVYRGANGVASEIGHMVVGENYYDCNCGKNGCLETFASATAIINYAKKLLIESKNNSSILDKINGDLECLNAKIIFDSAKEQDEIALKAVNRLAKYLGVGIVNIINTIDPEVIALGGGVSYAGEYLRSLVEEHVEATKHFKKLPVGKIRLAQLGNEAGIIGAAMLGKYSLK